MLERDISILFKRWLIEDALFDLTPNVPIFVYYGIYGWPQTEEQMTAAAADYLFLLFSCLKIIRIIHAREVTDLLQRTN